MKKDIKFSNRVNQEIKNSKIRIVNAKDFTDININEIESLKTALNIAEAIGTDLIEITENPKEGTSICKLMDIDKFKYQLKKKEKETKARKRETESKLKEIKIGVDIAENDFNTKLNQGKKFISKNCKLKLSCQLQGREKFMTASKEHAEMLLLKYADTINDIAKVAQMPQWQNSKVVMLIVPKK